MRFFLKSFFPVLMTVSFSLLAQDLKYIEYDTDLINGSEYKARRDTLLARLGKDVVAIFYAGPERVRNNDVNFQYHQEDNFYYLTGFTEPNAILILSAKGMAVRNPEDTTKMMTVSEMLFVEQRDPSREQWTGRRYGAEGAMKLRGFQYAVTNDKFKAMLPMMMFGGAPKYLYVPTFRSDLSGEIVELLGPLRSMLERMNGRVELRDPTSVVNKMRIIKSPAEIAMETKASQISALAHRQAMMSCEPGMHEYELQGVYEYVYRRSGAEWNGYPCIVGAAENSVILHYESDRRILNDGDVVLADCAAEYHGYSSDVTRTYPANGKFSPAQREVYQIVLDAQKACIALIKPGTVWRDVQAKSDEVVEEGLLKLGIIKEKGTRAWRKFYMHGVGHPVGLFVHDIGQPTLAPGMMYTVEPGIYIAEGSEGVDPKYFNIGVRIEDVVLVTEDGNKVLSADAPREVSEIEALMKKKGIGNEAIK